MKEFSAKYVFVQTERPQELIEYLESLGYGGVYFDDNDVSDYDTICIIEGTYIPYIYENVQKMLSDPVWTDCENYLYLFKRLAEMRSDTEVNQWFIHKSGAHLWQVDEDCKTFEEDYITSNDDPELKFEDYHRATQKELYDYFIRIYRIITPQ